MTEAASVDRGAGPGPRVLWFLNRVANPVVRTMLRSPLHPLLSRWLLVVAYIGRRSRRTYSVPVQYASAGDDVYVFPGVAERKRWWRNLRGGAQVRLRLRGRELQATADVLTPEGDREDLVRGLAVYLGRFPRAGPGRQVRRAPDGSADPGDLWAAAARAILVRFRIPQAGAE